MVDLSALATWGRSGGKWLTYQRWRLGEGQEGNDSLPALATGGRSGGKWLTYQRWRHGEGKEGNG